MIRDSSEGPGQRDARRWWSLMWIVNLQELPGGLQVHWKKEERIKTFWTRFLLSLFLVILDSNPGVKVTKVGASHPSLAHLEQVKDFVFEVTRQICNYMRYSRNRRWLTFSIPGFITQDCTAIIQLTILFMCEADCLLPVGSTHLIIRGLSSIMSGQIVGWITDCWTD